MPLRPSVLRRCLILLPGLVTLLVPAVTSRGDDLATLRGRMIKQWSVAPERAEVEGIVKSQQPDGSWSDIDYANQSRSAWPAMLHLSRLRTLAECCATSERPDQRVQDALQRGLDCWLTKDPQNPNWWWNRIGGPKSLLPILMLAEDSLTPNQREGGLKILRRAGIGMTGQNLVWVSEITAGLGVLERDAELVGNAYGHIAAEIRIRDKEGIQADYSFHQHGPCLYSHGYGAGFIADCSRIAVQVEGTQFAFPPEKIVLLNHLILDGTQWMTRGTATDFGAEGREITRQGQSVSHLETAARNMLQLDTGRERDLEQLLARATGQEAPPLVGNRHFWRSDFMVHQRPEFYASARMHSTRVANTDGPANSEGLLSHHLADGCMVLMRDGSEYHDIFPVWDWQRIPGTTVAIKPELSRSPRRMGKTDFVGGVSDTQFGLAACDFLRGTLTARKCWIFLDREVVCLGTGIRCETSEPVVTTLNQCLLRGPVAVSSGGSLGQLEPGTHRVSNAQAVWHDQVAYVLLEPAQLSISNQRAQGSWHRANRRYSDEPVTRELFTACIEHGSQPRDATYAYLVVPGLPQDQVAAYPAASSVRVIANSPQLQAAEQTSAGRIAAAFYEAGQLTTQRGWTIRVDQPCLLLATAQGDVLSVTVSNPRNTAATVKVTVQGNSAATRELIFQLPNQELAGSSVTQKAR